MGQRDIVLEVSATVVKASSKQLRAKPTGFAHNRYDAVPIVRTLAFRSEIFHQVVNRGRPTGLCVNLYGL
jgi:hypothetical protein